MRQHSKNEPENIVLDVKDGIHGTETPGIGE
jgi:hypothetical protein